MNAHDLVQALRRELAPDERDNRLVTAVAQGRAPREVIGALAAEEARIVASDRRSFLLLAARAVQPAAVDFFTGLAQGEGLAMATLPALAAAAGLDEAGVRAYRVQAGCQAYPAYLAWLALSGDPVEVTAAVLANFAAVHDKGKNLWPDNSKSGGDTASLPAIWENKADFEAKLAKLSADAKAKDAGVKDLDSFKAAMAEVGKDCGACHNTYRKKPTT